MSEADWHRHVETNDLGRLIDVLRASYWPDEENAPPPLLSDRKVRLFAAACCHSVGHLLDDVCRDAVQCAEQLAEGLVEPQTVADVRSRLGMAFEALRSDFPPISDAELFLMPIGNEENWKQQHDAQWPFGGDPDELRRLLAVQWIYDMFYCATSDRIWGRAYLHGGGDGGRGYCAASAGHFRNKAIAGAPPDDLKPWRARRWAEDARTVAWLCDIAGNPFRPVAFDSAWRTATVTSMAQAIYEERRFADLPILADALEDAGCTSADVLEHCRTPGEHVRGCWVVDRALGKK